MNADRTPEVDSNPYSSPAEAGGYVNEAQAGVGIWSDGNYLVFHREAAFPQICLKTGLPATRNRRFDLLWSYPIDWSKRRLRLQLPYSEDIYLAYRRRWLAGTLSLMCSILIAFFGILLLSLSNSTGELIVPLILMIPAGVSAWAILHWWDGNPVRFVRVRGPYFWISGASPQFLAQLPEWGSGI